MCAAAKTNLLSSDLWAAGKKVPVSYEYGWEGVLIRKVCIRYHAVISSDDDASEHSAYHVVVLSLSLSLFLSLSDTGTSTVRPPVTSNGHGHIILQRRF